MALDKDVIRGTAAECLATCLFVFIGTGAVVSTGEFMATNDDQAQVARIMPIAMAFGIAIMVLVYAFGHISGGHINPAVTLFLVLIKACEPIRGVCYILAQLLGATLGSLLLWGCTSELSNRFANETLVEENIVGVEFANSAVNPPFNLGNNALNPALNVGNGFLFEFMGTLLLCLTVNFTVLHEGSLAAGKPTTAPIAIGFAVFLAHVVLVPFTGCGINPARTFGPALVNSFAGNDVWGLTWFYFVGPAVAAGVAALIAWAFCDCDKTEDKSAEPQSQNGSAKDTSAKELSKA